MFGEILEIFFVGRAIEGIRTNLNSPDVIILHEQHKTRSRI
jgi:hypothetical protein